MIYMLALLIGVVAGLRAMTAPAAVSWAAFSACSLSTEAGSPSGLPPVDPDASGRRGTRHRPAPVDAEPQGADPVCRKDHHGRPLRRGDRRLGRLSVAGLVAGAVGAVLGTLGGAAAWARLAGVFGRDRPAALLEDALAILGAALIVGLLP